MFFRQSLLSDKPIYKLRERYIRIFRIFAGPSIILDPPSLTGLFRRDLFGTKEKKQGRKYLLKLSIDSIIRFYKIDDRSNF